MNVSHLSDYEVDKTWEYIFSPFWEIHHQGLKSSKGKATQFFIHVDG